MATSLTLTRFLVLLVLARCSEGTGKDQGQGESQERGGGRSGVAVPAAALGRCRGAAGLRLCHRQPDAVAAAVRGLALAVRECQHQMRGLRWNCSSLQARPTNPLASPIFRQGFRESALTHALTAAGVVTSVSRACVQGALVSCGCDARRHWPRGGGGADGGRATGVAGWGDSPWKWGGCSHNVRFGVRFARRFLGTGGEAGGTMLAKINAHNNRVGRMAVANNMQLKCKCHGVSGSCEMKTCWRTVPDFRLVGRLLRDSYRSAVLVDRTNLSGRSLSKANGIEPSAGRRQKQRRRDRRRKEWVPRKGGHTQRELSRALLYYRRSPDFCERDARLDVPGTAGRACNASLEGATPGGCGLLCCGRGRDLLRRRRVEQCQCQFRWCCQVDCQTCVLEEWVSVCK